MCGGGGVAIKILIGECIVLINSNNGIQTIQNLNGGDRICHVVKKMKPTILCSATRDNNGVSQR